MLCGFFCKSIYVIKSDRKITAVIVQTIAGLAAIKAQTFIDATGDAYLARSAGVPFERGYEKTGNNQPLSFRFEMGGIDVERLYCRRQKLYQ